MSGDEPRQGLSGVTYLGPGQWRAQIWRDSRTRHIGIFRTEVEAHEAYLIAKSQLPPQPKTDHLPGTTQVGDRWRAQIYRDGQTHYLGTFRTQWEAHQAWRRAKVADDIARRNQPGKPETRTGESPDYPPRQHLEGAVPMGKRWAARGRIWGRILHFGMYATEEKAHNVWMAAKAAAEAADRPESPRTGRDPAVSQRWMEAGDQRENLLRDAHEEALFQEAQRQGTWFFAKPEPSRVERAMEGYSPQERAAREALREPGMSDEELDRLIRQFNEEIQGQSLGGRGMRDRSAQPDDWKPARPADVRPEPGTPVPPGVEGTPLGDASRADDAARYPGWESNQFTPQNTPRPRDATVIPLGGRMSSKSGEGYSLTQVGINYLDDAMVMIGQVDEILGQALAAFLAAAADSRQDGIRQTVEYSSAAREKLTEVLGVIGETKLSAESIVW